MPILGQPWRMNFASVAFEVFGWKDTSSSRDASFGVPSARQSALSLLSQIYSSAAHDRYLWITEDSENMGKLFTFICE